MDDPWDTEDVTGLVLLQGFKRFSYPERSGRLMVLADGDRDLCALNPIMSREEPTSTHY